jgi:hypothetical protein
MFRTLDRQTFIREPNGVLTLESYYNLYSIVAQHAYLAYKVTEQSLLQKRIQCLAEDEEAYEEMCETLYDLMLQMFSRFFEAGFQWLNMDSRTVLMTH